MSTDTNSKFRLSGLWGLSSILLEGIQRRAPRWMLDHHLEWLHRFWVDPKRMWRRYIVGNPLFVWRVVMQRLGLLRLG